MDLSTLPALTVLSDYVTTAKLGDNTIVRINHPKANAAISLHGGHIISFKPSNQEELIWMSKDAVYDNKAALRGGIPICWPWFGRVATPAHGFARNSTWTLIEHRENDAGVIVSLGLSDNDQTREIWPHRFQLVLNVEVSETLTATLNVTNTDSAAWKFSGALHTYLNIGDIHNMEVTGMGPTYIDGLQEGKVCQGGEILSLTDTIDRVYTEPNKEIVLHDNAFNRQLSIVNDGDNSAVLWNPWEAGAKSMGDMNDDGYLTMFCIESTLHAKTLEAGQELNPGDTYQLATTLSVK
ncbi:D-hexose-6-phosphate mutarotase [Vibrio mediterranei]|uniref:D-hexose-6-phosphate mutarotase n=1 Tax=Vibrio sp. La 4.2.2 TaxID=2998830 RepID=UPI0022CE0951|nr:D-hexose-6-phosphate mutarotase [Vibrio sp. La 4.2.2]MDA0108324.1 D-hexose-6-phosphate mutarotase [Vibrio sp. La 4.2.2]